MLLGGEFPLHPFTLPVPFQTTVLLLLPRDFSFLELSVLPEPGKETGIQACVIAKYSIRRSV